MGVPLRIFTSSFSIAVPPVLNKFVRTKMRPKEGTKIKLQIDLSDFVRLSGLDLSNLSDFQISAI